MPNEGRTKVWIFLALLAVAAALLGASRVESLVGLELFDDQFFQVQWARKVVGAQRFLPMPISGSSFLAALEADSGCFLSAVLGPIYGSHELLLSVGSLTWIGLAGLVFEPTARVMAAAGIVAHWIALFLVGLFPVVIAKPDERTQAIAVGAIAFGFCAASAVLQGISTIGSHNTGLATLLAATVAGQRWLIDVDARDCRPPVFLGFVGLMAVALYSYHVSIFFLPMAVFLALLVGPSGVPRRRPMVQFCTATVLVLVPIAGLMAVTMLAGHADSGTAKHDVASLVRWALSTEGTYWAGLIDRIFAWFSALGEMVSPAFLFGGMVGVFVLARRGARLPMTVIIGHFIVSVLVPMFGEMSARTGGYVLPFLFLGVAHLIVASTVRLVRTRSESHLGLAGAVVGTVAAVVFLIQNVPQTMAKEGPAYQLTHRQNPVWPAIVRTIERQFPQGITLISATPTLQYKLSAHLSDPNGRVDLFRPIGALEGAWRQNTLGEYLGRRGIGLRNGVPIGIVVPTHMLESSAFGPVPPWLGPTGLGVEAGARLEPLMQWPDRAGVVLLIVVRPN